MIPTVIIVFILSQLADVATTQFALTSGRAHEGNPIVAWLMDRFGLGWIAIKLGLACGVAWWLYSSGNEPFIWVMSLAFFALAANNIRVAK